MVPAKPKEFRELLDEYLRTHTNSTLGEANSSDILQKFVYEKKLSREETIAFGDMLISTISDAEALRICPSIRALEFFKHLEIVELAKKLKHVRGQKNDKAEARRATAENLLDWLNATARIYFSPQHGILLYNCATGTYAAHTEDVLNDVLIAALPNMSSHERKEIEAVLQGLSGVSEFEPAEKILGFANGVFDFTDWKFKPHSPDYRLLTSVKVKYDPDAKCPQYWKFLNSLGDENLVEKLLEWTGYALYPSYSIRRAEVSVGPGRNGKSTYINHKIRLVGAENVSNVSLQAFALNRFAAAELHGKLINAYADLPKEALRGTDMFKSLTGGDRITVERKFGQPFSFVNRAKLGFSCNSIPLNEDLSDAFFSRLDIEEFSHVFEGKDADPNILDKITTPEELSGALNLALAALKRLLERGDFETETVDAIRVKYARLSDSVAAFCQERVEEDPDAAPIPKQELIASYRAFCREICVAPASEQRFFRRFPELVNAVEVQPKIGGKQTRCYAGIAVRPSKLDNQDKQEKTETKEQKQETLTLAMQDKQHFALSNTSLQKLPLDKGISCLCCLERVPSFVGAGGVINGPFEPGQRIEGIPSADAEFLLKNGFAALQGASQEAST